VIDYKLFLNDFEATAARLARKNVDRDTLVELHDLLEARKKETGMVDDLRALLNKESQAIGKLTREAKQQEVESRRTEVTKIKNEISSLETELRDLESKIDHIILRIPNLPADDCPYGQGEDDNVILRVHNYDEEQYKDKAYRPHWEIATNLGIYDGERAAKISGAMFALLRKQGAALLRSLISFGIALNRDRYEEVLPPHFVRSETFTATGHLPKFEMDAYKMRDDDLWAIPTGEVPLMGLHRDEILDVEELPKRYMAYTLCWRREAGSAGKDTRGMQRLHEFHKLELLKLCAPEQVQTEFESMLADAERPLQLLGLPYRVVDLCTNDLTFSSSRIWDLEVYSPGVNKWLEVSSVGKFTDFQARRGNIRFRRSKGKPEFVHALNGSAIATPRLWAAIIEHGQQADGSVRIPQALIPYFGSEFIKS
jgi:seryl-tRNA synthetase